MPAALLSKDEVLRHLIQVFRQYGYDGATLALLAEATGLVKASLYHRFPKGKQDMAQAVLDTLGKEFYETVLVPLQEDRDPRILLTEMGEHLKHFYSEGQSSCILELFSLGNARPLFQEYIAQRVRRWADAIADVLIRAGIPETTAQKRALQAIAGIEGALVLRRAMDDNHVFLKLLEDLPNALLSG